MNLISRIIILAEGNEKNYWEVINLKSDLYQEKRIQIFERWVGSNTFFLAGCQALGLNPRAIYFRETLIVFATHGLNKETEKYELICIVLGHSFQGKGCGVTILKAVINEMAEMYTCKEIYLSVIYVNFSKKNQKIKKGAPKKSVI
ncbi:GNAT family N-acetyltransferase [Psychrobacillus psychrodurans]|uniref:GNAT family N-acetyltransferase n=1 Tax=Psychrobacillus psychrodurans TaxID=126157 RepID=UPI000B89E575|nr:GNAT family N-acetyltransferase [Psychrobacillus psychrodurans]MCZ8542338.1 GNAT family N-acetyltransferase [Psychrobacillus psychrodurans]